MNDSGSSSSLTPLPAVDREALLHEATCAFQPIVDVNEKSIFGYEALVRGRNNESAAEILGAVSESERSEFDGRCITKAIANAAQLSLSTVLSMNLPATAEAVELVQLAQRAGAAKGIPPERLMLEICAGHRQADLARMRQVFEACRHAGAAVAFDRFGNDDAGLDLLAEFRPDAIKLSMELVRDSHLFPVRRAVVTGIAQVCREFGILVVAVGVETAEECRALRDSGLYLFQGHCFARPRFEGLPPVPSTVWARIDRRTRQDRRAQGSSRTDRRRSS